ncbi:hypothetical protein AB9G26_09555 [Francisella philomiragia]|uniref:hypothetical protein n=1 Tax=Francisella philomiragia TaxID=28110 RepID=UPI0035161E96
MKDLRVFELSELFYVGQQVLVHVGDNRLIKATVLRTGKHKSNKFLVMDNVNYERHVVSVDDIFYNDSSHELSLSNKMLKEYYPDSFQEHGFRYYYHGASFQYIESVMQHGLCGQGFRDTLVAGADKKTADSYTVNHNKEAYKKSRSKLKIYEQMSMSPSEEGINYLNSEQLDRNLLGLRNFIFISPKINRGLKYATKHNIGVVYRFKFKGYCFKDPKEAQAYITNTRVHPESIDFITVLINSIYRDETTLPANDSWKN